MKTSELKTLIKESVKEAIQEELKESLLEPVKTQNVITHPTYTANVMENNEQILPQTPTRTTKDNSTAYE